MQILLGNAKLSFSLFLSFVPLLLLRLPLEAFLSALVVVNVTLIDSQISKVNFGGEEKKEVNRSFFSSLFSSFPLSKSHKEILSVPAVAAVAVGYKVANKLTIAGWTVK